MSTPLKALHIVNCEMGSITSRADYSVKFSVVTPELRASESGELIRLHGKAVSVLITPLDGADADVSGFVAFSPDRHRMVDMTLAGIARRRRDEAVPRVSLRA
jgi:hypothetical protein